MSDPEPETVESLQAEIQALEDAIHDRQRILQEKEKDVDVAGIDCDEAEAEAQEAERTLAMAQEEFREVENTRTGLLPRYERCQQNKEKHKQAEEYRKQISDAERELRVADERIKALERELQDVSAQYKTERERRALLVGRVGMQLDELRGAVEEKVLLTVPIDESAGAPSAMKNFRALCENSRERETSIAQCARHARELASIVQMKQQRAVELRVESDREIAALKAVKDEQIKCMVLKFESERSNIQQDIDNVCEVNQQQQQELHRTKLLSDSSAFAGDITKDAPAVSRRDAASVAALNSKRRDIEQERQTLQTKLRKTAVERQQLIGVLKDLKKQIDVESDQHGHAIRNLDNQLQRDGNVAAALEKDNLRLEEMCDVLTASIKSQAMNQITA
jgi:hypothetical protein